MDNFDVDAFFSQDDDNLIRTVSALPPEQIEPIMMALQNHVDELNRQRGLVADVYSQKVEAARAAQKLADLSDENLQEELRRRQANAQTISINPIINPRPMGNQDE